MTRRALRLAAALVLLAGCQAPPPSSAQTLPGAQPPVADQASLRRVPLTIVTARGTRRFQVELAASSEEQARGLMFRTNVPKGTGMLFPMAPARPAAFWMKNTLIPLDIIFVRPDGTIARIAANTAPETLDLVESGEPVVAVLEIAGGSAAPLGIAEGNRVRWPGGPTG
ncbi:MAG: hypothetical protein JWM38_2531 [Sphingomonas bacterium]|nr:hypothetical protein [Sphingomonas bacterium]